jgi:hypothetical protein
VGDASLKRFMAQQTARQRQHIYDMTQRVLDRVAPWAEPYGIFPPVRFPAVAISMVAAAPWCDVEALTEMAMIPIWIYAIDDAYDKGAIPRAWRQKAVRRYSAVAGGDRRWADDPYAASLADLTARIARRSLWPALRATWVSWCRRMLAGMAFECETADRVREGARLPAYRTYLDHGLYSIGVPMYLAGAWIIDGDRRSLGALPGLGRICRMSGRAVRLANDLQTHAKEQGEGNWNAIMLLSGGDGSPAAALAVRERLNAAMRRLRIACRRLAPLRAATLVDRVTRFSVELYADWDYHTIPHEQILIHRS